ncbi:MAG: HupE/UreJ family protein [Thalassobaculaceae bacterium]
MRTFTAVLVAASVSGLAAPALAHTGGAPAAGAMAGFVHAFGGIDHMLTMVGVGALV